LGGGLPKKVKKVKKRNSSFLFSFFPLTFSLDGLNFQRHLSLAQLGAFSLSFSQFVFSSSSISGKKPGLVQFHLQTSVFSI